MNFNIYFFIKYTQLLKCKRAQEDLVKIRHLKEFLSKIIIFLNYYYNYFLTS